MIEPTNKITFKIPERIRGFNEYVRFPKLIIFKESIDIQFKISTILYSAVINHHVWRMVHDKNKGEIAKTSFLITDADVYNRDKLYLKNNAVFMFGIYYLREMKGKPNDSFFLQGFIDWGNQFI